MATPSVATPLRTTEREPPGSTLKQANDAEHFFFAKVRWQTYEMLLQDAGNRRIRLTFDRGQLELMTLSRAHELYKWLLGRLLEAWAEEMLIALAVGGSMTFRREDLERGLEPDECYWIVHEPQVRGRLELDFTRDPPPDLVIEVEVSCSVLDRLAILAALGVPEIWRFDGTTLQVGRLQPSGEYQWGDHSPTFPNLSLAELARFVQQGTTADATSVVRAFRSWARQQRSQAHP